MTQHTTPARLSAQDRAMLEEIAVFNNETISDAIRRAIRTEHALLEVLKTGEKARIEQFIFDAGQQYGSTYRKRVAELHERRRALLGDASPMLVR